MSVIIKNHERIILCKSKIQKKIGGKNRIMTERFGIYQSSSKSCVFYKQDKDGRQSTFNIFVSDKDAKKFQAFIDNEEIEEDSWTTNDEASVEDLVEAFGNWASDAPMVFGLEAQQSMSKCLKSTMKKEE